ncbi:UBC-like protein [Fomitiporia mediterranea MF3/22]|uniref:UBC-like protein n=1 Tax=Fomitiporia mediterranea (strain MF3/22) TaxID=694068 RepID=UPI0004408C32|nr:UBC-like protein [Fomitiporia mediterranea MF3/22]EJC98589.1 UBC-like protein [Fomitiporia mediterranea MF3/22]
MDAERSLAMSEVAMEYSALKFSDHCPKGMYIIPSSESILAWDGVLFVHQGYYADSILKFRIRFPFTYPARPPAVTFVTDVFHPLISQEDGTLNIGPRFSPWKPKQDHVFQMLHWIKVIFKKETLDKIRESDVVNREAFR